MVWMLEHSHDMEYHESAIKKEWSVVGHGLGVECLLSMQEALCSILSTTGKKRDEFNSGTDH